MYESKRSEQYDMADVPTYEEVMSYRRKSGERHRLVVLVGKCVCSFQSFISPSMISIEVFILNVVFLQIHRI